MLAVVKLLGKTGAGAYRYGFNGKEKDKDIDNGVDYDYGMRIYDSRLSRFSSVDPLNGKFPFYSPYQFAGNKPIIAIDIDGAEEQLSTTPTIGFKIVLTFKTIPKQDLSGYWDNNPLYPLDKSDNRKLAMNATLFSPAITIGYQVSLFAAAPINNGTIGINFNVQNYQLTVSGLYTTTATAGYDKATNTANFNIGSIKGSIVAKSNILNNVSPTTYNLTAAASWNLNTGKFSIGGTANPFAKGFVNTNNVTINTNTAQGKGVNIFNSNFTTYTTPPAQIGFKIPGVGGVLKNQLPYLGGLKPINIAPVKKLPSNAINNYLFPQDQTAKFLNSNFITIGSKHVTYGQVINKTVGLIKDHLH